ncbi:MAG: type I-B CRISPR-associated endonuclease Cas1 [Saprospiraceae bacterium]|nr:type I-B CRISPR-associated endonuclease Cas1 [Saprospiraceae bacterium]
MKKAYYLFNPGRMSRKDHTLKFEPVAGEDGILPKPRYLPVTGVSALYIFGSIDANSALYNFLGQQHIPVHFFDYYKHYTGSFSPKEYLLAGQMLIAQTDAYRSKKHRLRIARSLVEGATFNMLKNLRYYASRERNIESQLNQLKALREVLPIVNTIPELMGVEGNCRQIYYATFEEIVEGYAWEGRRKRPPLNELNALVSFGNSVCYTLCLDALYNSQLNPTVSYLHEPGTRRYSLALDMAEIFKPILVDRLIFKLCNRKELRAEHFEFIDDACFLSNSGRKVFVKAWEEKLQQSIHHRKLDRAVSYRHLVSLECYKLAKHLLNMDAEYEPFKTWW